MIMLILIAVTAVVFTIFVAQFYWSRRHLYAAAAKINGPKGLPLLGNALSFYCDTEDIHDRIKLVFENLHHEPMRFWLGPYLVIALKNPIHLEKIMSSQKFSIKHDLYEFLEKLAGDGLITASGLKPKYKIHRRIIQPMLDLKFVTSSLFIMNEQSTICMEKLEEHTDDKTFNILTVISPCAMDLMSEIIMGQKLNIQNTGYTKLCQAVSKLLHIGFTRMVKIWLHPDFVYKWHPMKKEQDSTLSILHNFINEAVIDSWSRRKFKKTNKFVPVIDTLTEFMESNPNVISNEDLINHMITLMSASEDTFAIIASFSIVCFGMYPEYQEEAANEIRDVIGEKARDISLEDVYKLVYLDRCVKDVMRLFPIAPLILRRTIEDYYLDKWTIPRGAAIAVPIYFLHRDPTYWANPEHFHPDHFLPEYVNKRHPYTYLPFSAGPRGCIGKTFANIQIKLFLAKFLQRYEVQADGKVPDLKLRTDISTRPKIGYNCKLTRRKWDKKQ